MFLNNDDVVRISVMTILMIKVSRMLAAKAALACRVDALAEETKTDLGVEHRLKVEERIRQLEGGAATKISGRC